MVLGAGAMLQRPLASRAATFSGRQQEASCSGYAAAQLHAPSRALTLRPLRRTKVLQCQRQRTCSWCLGRCSCRGQATCGPGLEQERDRQGEASRGAFSSHITVPTTAMAKGLGGGSMGGVTIERSKLDLSQKIQTAEPKVSNDGGGGNNGNKIFNGGGGDGGDDDDDDYFNFEDGDGDGDDGFWRSVVQQLYDEASIKAVLAEWFRNINDLPAIIRQSVQLGLFSSAQLVRFLAMDVRPNVTRSVTRVLPPRMARGVVGRLMADPAFAQKMAIEQGLTAVMSLIWEAQQRGERFTRELDLVALNTLSLMGATGAMVWLVSPSRSYGAVHKFPWQNVLHNLPNNAFDASTPYRRFTLGSRVASIFAKAAELGGVGYLAGGVQSLGGNALVRLRQTRNSDYQPAVPIPDFQRSSLGMAATMAVFANGRYQVVSGMDRYLFERFNMLLPYLMWTTVVRAASHIVGQATRLHLQGLPRTAPVRAPRLALPQRVLQRAAEPAKKRRVKKRSEQPAQQEDFSLSANQLRRMPA